MTGIRAGACLSLSGRFAQFGEQAANGLWLWADESDVALTIFDDHSDPAVLAERLTDLAPRVDLLFGPYSTILIRAALPVAEAAGKLLFNHGGSGGKLLHPGRVVNVLTPARRYALPFITHLAAIGGGPLYVPDVTGAFGRDVLGGAADAAQAAGIRVDWFNPAQPPHGTWDLLSAGVYEDDIATVKAAIVLPNPPRHVCSVAAGVAAFADDIADPDGVYGVGQWSPGNAGHVDAGMDVATFLDTWQDRYGGVPDYPAVQAYAAGVIAGAAVEAAGSAAAHELWQAAASLNVTTAFGRFRLDAATGRQIGHEAVLTRWHGGHARPVG